MIRFQQFNDDKSDYWKPYTEEQIKKNGKKPTFETVLMVDKDPSEWVENGLDPVQHAKYIGPMYLDFDDADNIDRVLDEVREVLKFLLLKLDIPRQYISCWLSGGKGVHITIPSQLFGIKEPTKFLPLVYREIMLSINEGAGLDAKSTVDKSVYSLGRGRMWRTEGWPRPGKGTYKVAVTVQELEQMDADQYHTLVASARPAAAVPEVDKDLVVLKCGELAKHAKKAAAAKVKAMSEAVTVPREELRASPGIPGCIQKLITEGDCEDSNWNQAAMQLAAYVAARYDRAEEEDFWRDLIDPFLQNVQSGSRDEKARKKHMRWILQKTFGGSFKLAAGPLIKVIGEKCGNCVICRQRATEKAADPDMEITPGDENNGPLHGGTKISWDSTGYWKVAENGRRQLTTFTVWVYREIFGNNARVGLQAIVIDDAGGKFDVLIPEEAWGSKREFLDAFKGLGEAQTYLGEADLQYLLKAIIAFSRGSRADEGIDTMTRSSVCGIIFEKKKVEETGAIRTIPHYVEAEGSITDKSRSHYRFDGEPEQSPSLLMVDRPAPYDEDMATAIKALCAVNKPVVMAQVIGWAVSCHFKQHIQEIEPQFPVLNLNGNAGAGKTSLAVLVCQLNGIDYTQVPFMNVEVGTMWPLQRFVTSSTTVPRLIEEVNPATCGQTLYTRVVGILKASWNRAPLQRGRLSGKEMTSNEDRVQSPIVYTSEQTCVIPAVRERSVEVSLQAKTRSDPKYGEAYRTAMKHRAKLPSLGKALLTLAMNTSPNQLAEIFRSKAEVISKDVTDRPKWSYQVVLTGLHMLKLAMEKFNIEAMEEVETLEKHLEAYLGGKVITEGKGRLVSEVGRVLETFDILADKNLTDNNALKAGQHYWRQGDSLYLVLQSCHPAYRRYMRSIGEPVSIATSGQLEQLIEGEIYHERTERHPTNPGIRVHVLSLSKLAGNGSHLVNFLEIDEPSN